MRLRDYLPRLIRSSELRRLREIEEWWNEEHPEPDPEAFRRMVESGRWKIGSAPASSSKWREAVLAQISEYPRDKPS